MSEISDNKVDIFFTTPQSTTWKVTTYLGLVEPETLTGHYKSCPSLDMKRGAGQYY